MASKYLRRSTWWVSFYRPATRELIRESLGTPHEVTAELLRERIDHEVALLDPRFQAVELQSKVQELVEREVSCLCAPEVRSNRYPPAARNLKSVMRSRTPILACRSVECHERGAGFAEAP
jgi:hypothetical protein